jgi:acyl-homoserine-lactone acylase
MIRPLLPVVHRALRRGVARTVLLVVATLTRAAEPWAEVEILRTEHGVPHVRAVTVRAAGYAMGWLQCEDHGETTPARLWAARGETALLHGRRALDADFEALRRRERAVATYTQLEPETRDYYEGFAAGVNRYLQQHPTEFPAHLRPVFTGHDVAALHIGAGPPSASVRRLFSALRSPGGRAEAEPREPDAEPEEASNAWALAPSRTQSGRAILLRNPHLAWSAGYYEAHVTVPGVVDFYGDFRIGGPFSVVGGFNRHLGWATTNSNAGDLTEIYTLALDPARPDHYVLDGVAHPLTRTTRTVAYRDGRTDARATREYWDTPYGPVVHRTAAAVYVARTAGDGEFRAGEQFFRLMRATSESAWLAAMRLRARPTQNYTYADRTGTILVLWNASLPHLPHAPGRGAPLPAASARDLWSDYIPFADLPLTRNPPGGYVQNANDSPHFANVRAPVVLANRHPNMERPALGLRGQLSLALIGDDTRHSLEDVVRLKHSTRMLLAERVKDDLLAAVATASPAGDVAAAANLLRRWDNTTSPSARGAVLFAAWWRAYSRGREPARLYAQPWTPEDPLRTPRGLADPARAARTFAEAVADTARLHGRADVAWGDVHRVRRGEVDVPVGGAASNLGSFRVLTFSPTEDGRLAASGGDGWVLAVEFGDEPRAYSVLAYGQSPKPASPWHADQAARFARGELKPVRFLAADVERHTVRRYRPGAPAPAATP